MSRFVLRPTRWAGTAALILVAASVAACGSSAAGGGSTNAGSSTSSAGTSTSSGGTSTSAAAASGEGCSSSHSCKVALIISDAGLGDHGFNDLGNAGMKKAEAQFPGVDGKAVQDPQIDTQCNQVLTSAAQAGYNLVINLNYGCEADLQKVAGQYPKVHFVMVDDTAKGSNVTNEVFAVQDSSFLAGADAAMLNLNGNAPQARGKTTVGAIGGTKSPGIDQFLVGYQQGAQYINKKEKVLVAYATSFADPSQGASLTKSMFSQGASTVYQVAGTTGLGGIKAAAQANLFAIGVDSNQDGLAKGHVLTSSIKRTDTAVYTAIKDYAQGKLKGNSTLNFTLANNGVAITPMQYTKQLLTAADRARLTTITKQIESGKIKVWNVPTQGYPKWFVGHK
jgi:basic membrane protein A